MGGSYKDNGRLVSEYYYTHSEVTKARSGDVQKIFSSTFSPAMDPSKTRLPRESCDSPECPRSRGIMVILDDTGSMNRFLTDIVQHQMKQIAVQVPNSVSFDPQILFGAVNDIRAGSSCPLQIGQFESGFNEMINDITSIYVEGGGGCNPHESYIIPYYFAAKHTKLECMEKRGEKGILFMIGDEPFPPDFTQSEREETFGKNNIEIHGTITMQDALEMAEEKFHVYQIIVHGAGYYSNVVNDWKNLLGGHALDLSDHTCIPDLIIAVMRMYDGMTKTEALNQISDSRTRQIVADAMCDHEETAEPEGVPTEPGEIEDF